MFQLFLIWFATAVISDLLRPKPKFDTPAPSALGDFQMPTAEYGRAVPVVYGECLLSGPNVTWFGDLRVDAIKESVKTGMFTSTTVTKGYKYFMGAQLVFCHGMSPQEVARGSGLVELRFDGKRPTALTNTDTVANLPKNISVSVPFSTTAYGGVYSHTQMPQGDTNTQFTRVTIDDPNLFGGEEKEGGVSGTIDFYLGQAGQLQSDYLQRVVTPDIPAYRGYCHAVMRQCYVGTTNYVKSVSAIVRRYPWFFSTSNGWNIDGDANPAAIIVDILTNKGYGLGIPLSKLDMDSFKYAADTCKNEKLGMSIIFDTQSPASELILSVLRHIDGVMYADPTSGLITLKLVRSDYDPDTLYQLDPDNVVELKMTRAAWADTKNIIQVRFTDRDSNYQTNVVEHKNQANLAIRGMRDEQSYDFLGLTTAEAANKVAARVLKSVSTPLARFVMVVNREAFDLFPGSVFKLSWAPLGIDNMVCRVTRIAYGELSSPQIEVEAIEDVFGEMYTAVSAPKATTWADPAHITLAANTLERLVEAPYHLLGVESRNCMSLAARSSSLLMGYEVHSLQGGTLQKTNDVPAFTPVGTLTAAYGIGAMVDATGFTVTMLSDASMLTSISDGELATGKNMLLIGDELMTYKTVTTNPDGTITISGVVRAVLDSLPASHAKGEQVWFISAGAGLVKLGGFAGDQTVTAKLLPYSMRETLAAIDAPVLTADLTSRAYKPYAPGNLRVSLAGSDAVFAWSHRPRRRMLSDGLVVSQVFDGYADAEGTYTVKVKVGGQVKRTMTGLTAASLTYTAAQRLEDDADLTKPVTFTIQAVDGGFLSAERETDPVVMS